MVGSAPTGTTAAERAGDELWGRLKPHVGEMIARNDPSVKGLTFDDIEANSAAAERPA